jgi:hypothetical protein
MKINLAELANEISERHIDVKCSFGEIRVNYVPSPVIWSLKPDWSVPPVPQKEMKLATGQTQTAIARENSPEFQEWQQINERWEKEQREIQFAGFYVLALDVEYPDDLSSPPPYMVNYTNGNYPENEILRKKIWLDATVRAKTSDIAAIDAALAELKRDELVEAEDVDEVKKNSESTLEGETSLDTDQKEVTKT